MRSTIAAAAAVVALAATLCCKAAPGDQWFSTNFDGYSLGDLNGQQGWSGNPGPVRISQSFSGEGRCIEMDCLEFGSGGGGVARSVTSGSSGLHYVEFRAAMDTQLKPGQSYANLCYIQFFTSSGTELTRFYFRGDRFNILLAGPDQYTILPSASDRLWHTIGLTFSLLTGKLDVLVDGVPVVQQGALYGVGEDIGWIRVGQWDQTSVYSKAECFVDDFVCRSREPAGIGRVALAPRFFPGWQAYNVCYPCVLFDGSYRMYYSGSGMGYVNDSTWDQWTTGYADSTDETKWVFPENYEAVLPAHKFMEGELVDPQAESARFDSIFAYMPCVIKDGTAYKMWYAGWNGDFLRNPDNTANKVGFRIGYAASPDGVRWTKHPSNDAPAPVLNAGAYGALDSRGVSHPWVLKKDGVYHMWYEGYDGAVWRIFHTSSSDGIIWQTPQLVLSPGTSGAKDDRNVRNPVVVQRSGVYEMWYQGESAASPRYHVLRATSSDGVVWTKAPGEVVLHPAAPTWPNLDPNDPAAQVLVNTVIPNSDGTCKVYYARQMTETTSLIQGTLTRRYFFIFREVVAL